MHPKRFSSEGAARALGVGIMLAATLLARGAAPDLDAIKAPDVAVEKVADGFSGLTGIGSSRGGFLLFADTGTDRIWKLPAGETTPTVWREQSGGVTGIAFDRQSRLLACEAARHRVTRTGKDDKVSVVAEHIDGGRIEQPHAVLPAIDGSIYVTDAGRRGAVYQVLRDGAVRSVVTDASEPRGLALTADQRTLYVSESGAQRIRVFAIKGDGRLVDGRVFARFPADARGDLGGMVTDLDGNLYCAGPGGVWVFAPDGRALGTIPTPEPPAQLSWGDDYRTLYLTAPTALYRVKLLRPGTRTH